VSADRLLRNAATLSRRRRFAEVIKLLVPQIYRFRDNAGFYRLVGVACLRTGDLGSAESYLLRADQLAPEDAGIRLALCALHARRGEADRALAGWLEVIDVDPDNRAAKHGLAILRAGTTSDELVRIVGSNRVESLLGTCPWATRRWWRWTSI